MENVNGPAFIETKSDMAELAAELGVEIELLEERLEMASFVPLCCSVNGSGCGKSAL